MGKIIGEQIGYDVLRWLLVLMDKLYYVFRVFAGVEPMTVDGVETDIFSFFFDSDWITQVFLLIFVIAIVVGAICCIVTVLRNMFTQPKQPKAHSKTLGQYLYSIVGSLAIILVVGSLIWFSNGILTEIDKAFNPNDLSLAQQVFGMSVENRTIPQPIQGEEIEIEDDNGNKYKVPRYGDPILVEGWKRGEQPIDIENSTFTQVFGEVKTNWVGLPIEIDKTDAIIDVDCFNFLVAYFATVTLLVVVAMSVLSLVKRLIDVIMLYLALPLVSSTVCLDDGARLKAWRDTMVSKVLLAYGSIFAINVFMLLCAKVNSIESIKIGNADYTSTICLVLIVGGALAINGGQILFSRILGTSAEEGREMGNNIRTILSGGTAAWGGLRTAKALAVGGYGRYGSHYSGVLPTALKAGGTIAFGRAFRSASTAFRQGGGLQGAMRAAKETGMGGVVGMATGATGAYVRAFRERTAPYFPSTSTGTMERTRKALKNNIKDIGGKKK